MCTEAKSELMQAEHLRTLATILLMLAESDAPAKHKDVVAFHIRMYCELHPRDLHDEIICREVEKFDRRETALVFGRLDSLLQHAYDKKEKQNVR